MFLDHIASFIDINRRDATPTEVNVRITGSSSTVLDENFRVSDVNGEIYKIKEPPVTIPGDTNFIITNFVNTRAGAFTVERNSINNIVSPITNIDTVNNPSAGITGKEKESDEDFLKRYRQTLFVNASTNINALTSDLFNVNGVTSANVFENDGDSKIILRGDSINSHSIYSIVDGGDSTKIVEKIALSKAAGIGTSGNTSQTYTYENGTQSLIRFSRPIEVPLTFRSTITSNNLLPPDIIIRIKNGVNNYVNSLFPGLELKQFDLLSSLFDAVGPDFRDYTVELLLKNGNTDVFSYNTKLYEKFTILDSDFTLTVT